MNGIRTLIKRPQYTKYISIKLRKNKTIKKWNINKSDPRAAFNLWGYCKRVYEPGSRLPADTRSSSTLILDFPVSRNVSDTCLRRKSLSLRYICYTAWTDWDAFNRGPFLTLPTSVLSTSLCTSAFYDLIPWHALESSNLFSSNTLPFFLEDLAQTPFLQVLHDSLRPAASLRWLDGAHIGCLATSLSMQ